MTKPSEPTIAGFSVPATALITEKPTDLDQHIMLDAPEAEARPLNEHWQARRELAAVTRELIQLMATSTAGPHHVRQLTKHVREQLQWLKDASQCAGRSALAEFEQGQLGAWVDIARESNPVSGQSNPLAPPLKLWLDGDTARGRVTLGWPYEGPPSGVHGGYLCALFDHFLGMAQRLTGQPGVTGNLGIRFHQPTPLNTELELVGRVLSVEGRKNRLSGELWAHGLMTASCEATFIHIDRKSFQERAVRMAKPD